MIKDKTVDIILANITKVDKKTFNPSVAKEKELEFAKRQAIDSKQSIKYYGDEIKKFTRNLKDKTLDVKKFEKAEKKLTEELKEVKKSGDKVRAEKLNKIADKISRLPIKQLMTTENGMIFITEPLKIGKFEGEPTGLDDWKLNNYKKLAGTPIGSYIGICYFDINDFVLKLRSLDYITSNYSHPFIQGDSVCMGSSATLFKKWWLKRDYSNIIELAIELLITPITNSPFIHWKGFLINRYKISTKEQKKIIKLHSEALEVDDYPLFDIPPKKEMKKASLDLKLEGRSTIGEGEGEDDYEDIE